MTCVGIASLFIQSACIHVSVCTVCACVMCVWVQRGCACVCVCVYYAGVCMRVCVYLQLLVLQQSDDELPDDVHRLLVTQEGEEVVEDHDLQVGEHRVARVPGAAARDLERGGHN